MYFSISFESIKCQALWNVEINSKSLKLIAISHTVAILELLSAENVRQTHSRRRRSGRRLLL